eukprot:TRINITY_DN21757_c0_g1_i1.p1 TRINITY_DN21757_c0_g1~~TRINITY_DN21757_c0_g1_i1.p1  ORF type:complete len:328 (+),score=98.54 TRINITY_DN21757_c0_g1_i1:80-1063(+)
MSPARVELFFDYSSPWTFLAFSQLQALCAKYDAELVWRPMLVGALFNTVNPSVYQMRKQMTDKSLLRKLRYSNQDMQMWADGYGIKIRGPYGGTKDKLAVFPVNSAKSLRGAFLAMEKGVMSRYSWLVFRSYWSDGEDISDEAVLRRIAADAGLAPDEFMTYVASAGAKAALRANVDDCTKRGAFGSPTVYIGDRMFFGNDRLPLIEMALKAACPSPLSAPQELFSRAVTAVRLVARGEWDAAPPLFTAGGEIVLANGDRFGVSEVRVRRQPRRQPVGPIRFDFSAGAFTLAATQAMEGGAVQTVCEVDPQSGLVARLLERPAGAKL